MDSGEKRHVAHLARVDHSGAITGDGETGEREVGGTAADMGSPVRTLLWEVWCVEVSR